MWLKRFFARVWPHFALKVVGISVFMTLFLTAYLHILKNPLFPVTMMPLTALDHLVGFEPAGLLLYVTLWVYVSIPPTLLVTRRTLIDYGLWITAVCVAGLICFVFWPTAVPKFSVEHGQSLGLDFLNRIDTNANACPSLHVATAAFSAWWLDVILREMKSSRAMRAFNWLWFAGIVWSTMAIKQHVLLDVIAGLVLGFGLAWPSLRRYRVLSLAAV